MFHLRPCFNIGKKTHFVAPVTGQVLDQSNALYIGPTTSETSLEDNITSELTPFEFFQFPHVLGLALAQKWFPHVHF